MRVKSWVRPTQSVRQRPFVDVEACAEQGCGLFTDG